MSQEIEKVMEEAPFNMAMLFYIRLNKLLEAKCRATIENDQISRYRCLAEIYRAVIFKIGNPERKEISDALERVKNCVFTTSGKGRAAYKATGMNLSKAAELMDDVDIRLSELMNKAGMIFPRVDGKNGFIGLAKRYEL